MILDDINPKDLRWWWYYWICQVIFFIVTTLFFVYSVMINKNTDLSWWYYYGEVGVLVLSSIGVAVPKKFIKDTLIMSCLMANVFVIPMVIFHSGQDLGVSAGVSLIYIIAISALAPVSVSLVAALSAIAFSSYLHYDHNVFQITPKIGNEKAKELVIENGAKSYSDLNNEQVVYKVSQNEMSLAEISIEQFNTAKYAIDIYNANKDKLGDKPKANLKVYKGMELHIPDVKPIDYKSPLVISFIYIFGVIIGFGWKIYILKFVAICKIALENTSTYNETEVLTLKDELAQKENDCRLLKEEIAIIAVEMKHLLGYNKDT
jgi:hypothetical protein